ncbi:MAG TPA: EthD family reductase [Ktedonosporobacter sp.]|nr:EthD family reductase [Ktedonosporobacter sp.]
MIQLTVLYGHPQDPAAFDQHYQQTHAVLAQKIPGLKGFVANKPSTLNPQEPSPYYFVVQLYFEGMAALQQALQSPEGQAAAGDLQNFATGGVALVAGEVQVYRPVSLS